MGKTTINQFIITKKQIVDILFAYNQHRCCDTGQPDKYTREEIEEWLAENYLPTMRKEESDE